MKKTLWIMVGLGLLSQVHAENNPSKKSPKEPIPKSVSTEMKALPTALPKKSGRYRLPVEKGMTQEAVKTVLGEPDSKTTSSRGYGIWTYRKESLIRKISAPNSSGSLKESPQPGNDYQIRFKKDGTLSGWIKVPMEADLLPSDIAPTSMGKETSRVPKQKGT